MGAFLHGLDVDWRPVANPYGESIAEAGAVSRFVWEIVLK